MSSDTFPDRSAFTNEQFSPPLMFGIDPDTLRRVHGLVSDPDRQPDDELAAMLRDPQSPASQVYNDLRHRMGKHRLAHLVRQEKDWKSYLDETAPFRTADSSGPFIGA